MLKKITSLFKRDIPPQNQTGVFSIQGRKPSQQDNYFISELRNNRRMLFVADGVGGHSHGEFASETAVDIFKNSFIQSDSFENVEDFLRKTTLVVAAMVLQKGMAEPEYKNCGTTLSGFYLLDNTYYVFNVGDSRVYLYSENKLQQLTKDQSKVQQLIDEGALTPEQAATHPERHIMTSAIGQSLSMIKNDISGPFDLNKGDILLAFSDGVHDPLSNKQLEQLISSNKNNNNLAQTIVEQAFNAGGTDNITALYYKHI